MEGKTMSAKVSSEYQKTWNIRSIALMSAKRCSKAVLAPMVGYGKSPCFSEVDFLSVLGPDYPMSILPSFDGADFLECAL
jgi:hypothetical protein